MPKVKFTHNKGLIQSAGSGVEVQTSGLITQVWTASTSLVDAGAADIEMTLTQPGNTVLVDIGFVLTTALAGSSGNSIFRAGTGDDGEQLVADTNFMSSATAAAVGSGISLTGLKSEGAASLAVVADAAVYTSTDRTLYLRLQNSAAITAGEGRGWITYQYLP
tara:strand:+ start:628 stop:1116 length:489 start_codon:yes stop_codon:yes gene_type:complete